MDVDKLAREVTESLVGSAFRRFLRHEEAQALAQAVIDRGEQTFWYGPIPAPPKPGAPNA